MIGQLSDQDFMRENPTASTWHKDGVRYSVVKYGKSTYNYFVQHEDHSWTNYAVYTT